MVRKKLIELVVLPGEELGGRPRANGGALKVHEAHDHPRQARLHRAREKHAVHVSFYLLNKIKRGDFHRQEKADKTGTPAHFNPQHWLLCHMGLY